MPENISIKSDELVAIARGQAVVEARQMYDGECRILSVTATPTVVPGEIFSGEARYAGKVRFDCLVVAGGKPDCISAVAEFSDKIICGDIVTGMAVTLVPEAVNTEATVVDGYVRLTAVIDTAVYAVVRREFDTVAEPGPGIYTEKLPVEHCVAVACPAETAYITDSIRDIKAESILMCPSAAVVTGAECGEDEVRISGAVYTTLVVRTEDGLAASYKNVTPFVKSLSAPGVTQSDTALPCVTVSDSAATLTVEDDSRTAELAVTLTLAAAVLARKRCDMTVDVFSADNELETSACDAVLSAIEPSVTAIDCVDGQVALDASLAADNVLCVTNTFCTVTDARVDGRVYVEGLAGGDIVYYNAEKNAVSSIAFRLPFAMPLAVHSDAGSVDVRACLTDVTVKIRRGSVFDVKAEIAFTARLYTRETVKSVCAVKIGEHIDRPDATVTVHIARPGETLWQAAKALGCSPERVAEQNQAQPPYAGGERLVCFCECSHT